MTDMQKLKKHLEDLVLLLDLDVANSQDRGAHLRAVQQYEAAKSILDMLND